jgi:hypothetical protein
MDERIYVFGHGDTRPILGFPTDNEFVEFIQEGVFRDAWGRYRHSNMRNPTIIVLSRYGRIFGHFVITEIQRPTEEDKIEYDKTKRVYIVCKSILYERQVPLAAVGIGPINFGPSITEDMFDDIRNRAGTLTTFQCPNQ